MSLPESARALLALPPDRFVEERDALARALAAKGDRAAGEVRKLRRPVGLAWVLNRLARDRAADVEALLRAGDRLRAGQRRALRGEGPEELRAAETELRERARALRLEAAKVLSEAGRGPGAAALSRLELLLRTVAPAPGPERDAFREGLLASDPAPGHADLGGLAVLQGGAVAAAPASRGGRAPRAPSRARAGTGPSRRAAADREAAEREREARRAEAEAERRRAAARRDLARAEARVGRAEAAARRAEAAAERASERARELRAAAKAERAELDRRRQALGLSGAPR